jgi:hypothetical protein
MKQPQFRQAVILFTLVTCVFYLVYRACFTLNFTTPYAAGASLALYVAELFMGVLMLLFPPACRRSRASSGSSPG